MSVCVGVSVCVCWGEGKVPFLYNAFSKNPEGPSTEEMIFYLL